MSKLVLINLLERQIKQEINRLQLAASLDWEKEQTRLTIYQSLIHPLCQP